MAHDALEQIINEAFENRDDVNFDTSGDIRDGVNRALDMLDSGEARVAEKGADGWVVNQWLKKAVLLSFRLNDMSEISGGPGGSSWWDKVPSKFDGWGEAEFRKAGFRAVPNCTVRRSAFIAPGVVLMPSFVNLGAYVDSGAMIDTWATVGSCAQIGKNVHISGGAGIGGTDYVHIGLAAGRTVFQHTLIQLTRGRRTACTQIFPSIFRIAVKNEKFRALAHSLAP